MGKIHRALGLTVGVIVHVRDNMKLSSRQA